MFLPTTPRPRFVLNTCREGQEGLIGHKVSILVEEMARVESPRGLPALGVIQHRAQIRQDDGTLQRRAGVAHGGSN